MFNLMAQYSAAAYCSENDNMAPGTAFACSAGNCPLVEAAGAVNVIEFHDTILTDTTGFLAIDPLNRLIVLSFRGSRSIRNFIHDLHFSQTYSDICMFCAVHSGFWAGWLEVRDQVLAAMRTTAAAYPDHQIIITGHSLGGALANLAAAEIRKAGIADAALYTYGAPRIGNYFLSSYITNQAGGNFRITHTDDPIPRLPPILLNYVHVSPEYYITQGNSAAEVRLSFISVLAGFINFMGNGGKTGFDVPAHLEYFGPISNCSASGFEFKRN
ncbi:MAG: hypothetical protein M1829_000075 [Trizodia sp. TS-e1964]|nr:MAG: hypothetical protein M1829_000075 [Trizodia sp. TS-e1964]